MKIIGIVVLGLVAFLGFCWWLGEKGQSPRF